MHDFGRAVQYPTTETLEAIEEADAPMQRRRGHRDSTAPWRESTIHRFLFDGGFASEVPPSPETEYPGAIETMEQWGYINGCKGKLRFGKRPVFDMATLVEGKETTINRITRCPRGVDVELRTTSEAKVRFLADVYGRFSEGWATVDLRLSRATASSKAILAG
jgi:hypothetical protein